MSASDTDWRRAIIARTKKTAKPLSYAISVSLATGLYRHIRISADSTFDELSRAILSAYGFDNDHLHAFFLDNRFWSRNDDACLWYEPESESEPSTSEVLLRGLTQGAQFKYLFDFGDEWRFSCKVLRVVEEPTPVPTVIRSVGAAPAQYPEWDDEWDEDEEDDEDPDEEE